MVGIWHAYADVFLIVAGVAMLAGFGLPMLLLPINWARLFRWEMPSNKKFTIFLERSLGIFIIVMSIFAFIAGRSETVVMRFYFNLMLVTFVGMISLHIYGAIKKLQPKTETYEIAMWAVLSFVTILFYPLTSG